MSLLLAAALVTAAPTLPSCSWDRPGVNPFMGNVVAAVDRYTDIPADVRARLKARVAARQYDEIASIRRDSITGKARYSAEIRDMHFGNGQVCRTVTRTRWSDSTVERGLVYCESGHCLIVPTVCRNVSRITRLAGPAVATGPELPPNVTAVAGGGAPAAQGDGGDGRAQALQVVQLQPEFAPGEGEISFAAPGAGPAASNGGEAFASGSAPAGGEQFGSAGPAVGPSGMNGGGLGDGPAFSELATPEGPRSTLPGRTPLGANSGGGGVPMPLSPAPSFGGGGGGGGGGVFLPPRPETVLPELNPGPLPAVPEPSTLWLGLGGALLLTWRLRLRRG